MLLRCYLQNVGYYSAIKFRFKIIRLTRTRAPQAALPRFRGTGLVKLSFPAILIALLIDGLARCVLPRDA
jgi:hypothetical protein